MSGAAFNGTHRFSARVPEDVVPNEVFSFEIKMHLASWVFPPGYRICVAISNSMWPMLWPTPTPFKSTLMISGNGGARIQLPVIPPEQPRVPESKEPVTGPRLQGFETLDADNSTGYAPITEVQVDPETDEAFGFATKSGANRFPWGVQRFYEQIEHRTHDEQPATTSVTGRYFLIQEFGDRTLRFEQEVSFSSDIKNFYLRFDRKLLLDGEVQNQRVWDEVIERDFQ